MSWHICIPSYKRPAVLARKTLKTLLEGKVPPERITVYVADEAEEIEYRASVPSSIRIVVGVLGLANQRKFIQSQWPVDTRLVFFDDDITAIKQKVGTGLGTVLDIPKLIDEAFAEMEKAGANIWGVYPACNGLFLSNTVATKLCYIIGALYGIKNTEGAELKYGDNQEDKERTLRYWKRDGVVCRLNSFSIRTQFYAPGGMDTPTRKAETKIATQQLVEEFPDLITQVYKEKIGIYDIKFKTSKHPR
jgi:hypothetical protein